MDTQLFRSGIIEYLRVYEPADNGLIYIPSVEYERALLESYQNGTVLLRDLGFEPPIYVFLTLAGVRGSQLATGRNFRFFHGEVSPFDRDVLAIPNVEMLSFNDRGTEIMKPMFDIVWNAAGYPVSPNFDENLNWRPP